MPTNTTWNPSDKTASITLSGGNLTATASIGLTSVRAIDKQLSGKFYFEFTMNVSNASTAIGLVTQSAALSTSAPADPSVYVNMNGSIYVNAVSTGIQLGARTSGDTFGVAVDLTNRLIWFRVAPSGNWNASPIYSPGAGIGGVAFTGGGAIPMYPWAYFNAAGNIVANFGDSAFVGAVPAGFTSGFTAGATISTNMIATQALAEHWVPTIPPVMQATQVLVEHWAVPSPPPFTSWNPSDKEASITLSGGNLTATAGISGVAGVRAVDKQITGKFYWEVTLTTWTTVNDAVGIASPNWTRANGMASGSGAGVCGLTRSINVWVDGASVSGVTFGTITSGTVVCIAFDAATRLVWFRLGAAGNWNVSASANPATGVGGIATNLGAGVPVYPAMTLGITSDAATANFGGSAFTGAVPAGFTSGFTAGATSPTNALATQAGLEQWVAPNPLGQVTQVSLEEWVSTSVVTVQALVTQVALEQWARVPVVVPPPTGRPRRVQNVVRR